MTPAQRLQAEDRLLASDSVEQQALREEAMAEGERHLDAKVEARDTLREFFRSQRPGLFVAADIPVYYPGQKAIRPDLLAVHEVATHVRDSWMVTKEGKGIDLALEIHHKGNWRKDFVDNVERYAGLGIHEYFAFDLERRELRGWRLSTGGRAYHSIRGYWGRFKSEVLGLDLLVEDGALRFFFENAELLGGARLVHRLQALSDSAIQRAEAEAQRAEALTQALIATILLILSQRGVPLSTEQEALIRATRESEVLQRWARLAFEVRAAADLLAAT